MVLFSELVVYCFFVGLGEGVFFLIMNYVFGSWYWFDEIVCCFGLFYVVGFIGIISNGFIFVRILEDFDGVFGWVSWVWKSVIKVF